MANISPDTPQNPLLPQNAATALHDSAISMTTTVFPKPIRSPTTPTINISRTRALQNVLTHAERIRIASWAINATQEVGVKNIPLRAARQISMLSRGNEKANNAKACRLWKSRERIANCPRGRENRVHPFSITRVKHAGFKRVYVKVRAGRGRKQARLVEALHVALPEEFERLRNSGLNFNGNLLRNLAMHLVHESSTITEHKNMRDSKYGILILEMITARLIQALISQYQILSRAQTGKLIVSPEKRSGHRTRRGESPGADCSGISIGHNW